MLLWLLMKMFLTMDKTIINSSWDACPSYLWGLLVFKDHFTDFPILTFPPLWYLLQFMFDLLCQCLSEVIPSGVWVVWSVGGPWKRPLASTQSCPCSLCMLTQLHCPDSKSQLPGGLQAPGLTEISSNFTAELLPGTWVALNTNWRDTQAVIREKVQNIIASTAAWSANSERKGVVISKQELTRNSVGDDTVTSATSQSEDGAPERCQRASASCPFRCTCTARLSDPAGILYLKKHGRETSALTPDTSVCVFSTRLTRSAHINLQLSLIEAWAAERLHSVLSLTSSRSCRSLQRRERHVSNLNYDVDLIYVPMPQLSVGNRTCSVDLKSTGPGQQGAGKTFSQSTQQPSWQLFKAAQWLWAKC